VGDYATVMNPGPGIRPAGARSKRIIGNKRCPRICSPSKWSRVLRPHRLDRPYRGGKTGTGKELIAHAIPQTQVRRYGRAFIKLNCAGHFHWIFWKANCFGHEKGGLHRSHRPQKIGRFENGRQGHAIFGRKLGDIPPGVGSRSCCVCCKSRSSSGLGSGSHPQGGRSGLVAATNRDLIKMVGSRAIFAVTCYYRLKRSSPSCCLHCESAVKDIPALVGRIS